MWRRSPSFCTSMAPTSSSLINIQWIRPAACFMRVEFDLEDLNTKLPQLEESFREVADQFRMEWNIYHAVRKKRLAILFQKKITAL